MGFLDWIQVIIWAPVIIFILIVAFIIFKLRYKIVQANEVLVISGGREKLKKGMIVDDDGKRKKSSIKVLRAGGAFISPFHRWDKFSLSVMTIQSEGQTTQSSVVVPVMVRWTAQIKADDRTNEALETAITNFLGFKREDIEDALKQSLDGEVRAVIGTKTPEEIVTDKNSFGKEVRDGVQEKMEELGFRLLSLNIAEVTDPNDYYVNLAAKDREAKRQDAENIRAEADKEVRTKQAQTRQASESAELEASLIIAEKERDVDVRKAGFKSEKAEAEAAAEYARQIQDEAQKLQLELRRGDVAVTQEEQRRRAATAKRDVEITEAETAKQRLRIEAEAVAAKAGIDADARVVIAEKDADAEARAAERRAIGQAEAVKKRAEGNAAAMKIEAEAEADKIKATRKANAEGIEAEGRAEAEAIRLKGLAEAEAAKAKAEALAEQDGVNLQVTLAEIESHTRIQVSSAIATAVAEIGTNTTIIDMGGGGSGEGGDLLSRFLGNLPETLAKLDVKNAALNGQSFSGSLNDLIRAVTNKSEGFIESAAVGAAATKVLNKAAATATPQKNDETDTILDLDDVDDTSLASGKARAVSAKAAYAASGGAFVTSDTLVSHEPEAQIDVDAIDTTVAGTTKSEPTAKDRLAELYTDQAADKAARVAIAGKAVNTAPEKPAVFEAKSPVAVTPQPPKGEPVLVEIPIPQENSSLVSEAKTVVANVAANKGLDAEETKDLAQVYAVIKSSGLFSDNEVYELATQGIDAIKALHDSGEGVNVSSIVTALVGLKKDGKVGTREILDFVKKAKAVAGKRR